MPPFRGEERSGYRGAFLRFRTVDDAHVALRMLDGRVGPGGEVMRMGLSRPPLVHLARMWQWAYKVQDMGGGEACLEDEWEGLGFGTGKEEQDDNTQDVRSSVGIGRRTRSSYNGGGGGGGMLTHHLDISHRT